MAIKSAACCRTYLCKYSSEYRVLSTGYSTGATPPPTPRCSPTPLLELVISKIACINALNVNEWVTSRGELLLMMLRHLQLPRPAVLPLLPLLLLLAAWSVILRVACFISRRWNMPTSVVVVVVAFSGHDSVQALACCSIKAVQACSIKSRQQNGERVKEGERAGAEEKDGAKAVKLIFYFNL